MAVGVSDKHWNIACIAALIPKKAPKKCGAYKKKIR
jgi:hypothetical protein